MGNLKAAPDTNLSIRLIPFDFDQVKAPIWNTQHPEWSHMVNGASLAMPYLEPFLIRNMREASKYIKSEQLKGDVRGFIAQEGQHYQNHRKYNEMLKANGYPDLADVEDLMTEGYKKLQERSLKWKLAYTAGFETMTLGVTDFLIDNRQLLFKDADPIVTSLILWHFVEETEHKNVAFDLYTEVFPKQYLSRIRGIFASSYHLMKMSRQGYVKMLKRDGKWKNLKSRFRLYKMVALFFINVMPALIRAMHPNFHPSKYQDPKWVKNWSAAYSNLNDDELPLLNTSIPDIPPQFITEKA